MNKFRVNNINDLYDNIDIGDIIYKKYILNSPKIETIEIVLQKEPSLKTFIVHDNHHISTGLFNLWIKKQNFLLSMVEINICKIK